MSTQEQFDLYNQMRTEQPEHELTQDDIEAAERASKMGHIPAGDYLMTCREFSVDKSKKNIGQWFIRFTFVVDEPAQFRGKEYEFSVPMPWPEEENWSKNKRIKIAGSAGFATTPEEIRKIDWVKEIYQKQFVQRVGLVLRKSSKGNEFLSNETGDYAGLYPKAKWNDKDWVQKAPQDIPPRDNTGGHTAAVRPTANAGDELDVDVSDTAV